MAYRTILAAAALAAAVPAAAVNPRILRENNVITKSTRDLLKRASPSWNAPKPRASTTSQEGTEFDQFESTLKTMQSTYWNGSYWPTTIQWEGAVMNTLLGASDRTFLNIIVNEGGTITGSDASTSSLQSEIQTYYSEIEAYYGNEDTDQIFQAAYDDAQWVVLEWIEALKFINQYDSTQSSTLGQGDIANFAHRAHIFYNIVQDQFDTSLCGGGITWNPALAVYKNAVTNELLLDTSVAMYLYFPGDNNTDPYPSSDYQSTYGNLPPLPVLEQHNASLLQLAKDEYSWFTSQPFLNSQGLVIDGFHVSDGQTTCDQPDPTIYTYNQGIMLSGLRQLWEATGDDSYLTDGYNYIWSAQNATQWFASGSAAGVWGGLGRYGVMEDSCDAPGNCSQDANIFKGVYFDHLDAFCTPLPTDQATIPGITYTASAALAATHSSNCANYTQWVEHNAQAALSTLTDGNTIMGGWWAESYVDGQTSNQATRDPPVYGADIMNKPWLLNQSPWVCKNGEHGCNPNGRHKPDLLRRWVKEKRDSEVRTVETEASGLSVCRAAIDMSLNSS